MKVPLNEISAAAASRLIAERQLTSEELVRACLERATTREPELHVWAHLDHTSAIEEARLRDAQKALGPLHGVPVAVKDLFDVTRMPASYGSPIYADNYPTADALCVLQLRAAGAVILGKTETVEFAASKPTRTRNPRNLEHTPGGSSSGSAAAVADYQVPLALGTQTGGSIIRPAAFCGVVGFKPSFGRFGLAGCKACAPSLDTIGFIARDVEDCDLIFAALANIDTAKPFRSGHPPRIGVFVDPEGAEADASACSAVEAAAKKLPSSGATLSIVESPPEFQRLRDTQRVIARFEMARSLAHEWNSKRELLSDVIKEEITEGLAYSHEDYLKAQNRACAARNVFAPLLSDLDFLLTIATTGEAPRGLNTTGSAFFNSPWTLLGNPAICLPFGIGPAGLPTAIQLIGRFNGDEQLLRCASWVETALCADSTRTRQFNMQFNGAN